MTLYETDGSISNTIWQDGHGNANLIMKSKCTSETAWFKEFECDESEQKQDDEFWNLYRTAKIQELYESSQGFYTMEEIEEQSIFFTNDKRVDTIWKSSMKLDHEYIKQKQ